MFGLIVIVNTGIHQSHHFCLFPPVTNMAQRGIQSVLSKMSQIQTGVFHDSAGELFFISSHYCGSTSVFWGVFFGSTSRRKRIVGLANLSLLAVPILLTGWYLVGSGAVVSGLWELGCACIIVYHSVSYIRLIAGQSDYCSPSARTTQHTNSIFPRVDDDGWNFTEKGFRGIVH